MGVLDRLKAYQRLSAPPMEATQEPSTQETDTLPVGEISQQGSSFLQQFILELLKKNNVPVQALKFIPGFGDHLNTLLFGDPYQAHTYFADMHYQVQLLLDQDKDWDPVELSRRAEYAEAEERAALRQTAADYNERLRASALTSSGGSLDGTGADGVGEVHSTGFVNEKIPRTLSYSENADY